MDYTLSRVQSQLGDMPRLQGVYDLMRDAFGNIRTLPNAFKPRYVTRVYEKIYNATLSLLTIQQMETYVAFHKTPDPFLQGLVLACA